MSAFFLNTPITQLIRFARP